MTPSSTPRRDFLTALACLPLAAGCALTGRGSNGSSRWKIGCYTRPWDQHEYRVALDGIAEAGFEYAGIMTAKGKSWVMITPETTPEEAAAIGEAVRSRGLKTASVYADFKPRTDLAGPIADLQRLIVNCAACGSPDLLLGGTEDAGLAGSYFQTIKECCDFAVTQGVRLTVKPHGGQNATGAQCRAAIERVGHHNFKLWYDPGNIFYYSDGALDPVDDAATVDGLVVGMSVKDFLPPKEVMVTPGTGRVDFPTVFRRLQRGGFKGGPLVVECVSRPDPTHLGAITAEARKAREFLAQVVG